MENSSKINTIDTLKDDNIVELIEALEEIDESKSAARLNEISMIGSDGRRIYY